jgi:hypothetical protein
MKTIWSLAAMAVIVVAVSACSTAGAASAPATTQPGVSNSATTPAITTPAVAAAGIRTAPKPPDACMDALLGGKLAKHPLTGLGVTAADGKLIAVEWPFGYSARMDVLRVALLDETGKVVGHEGDEITVGGGLGNQLWFACGPVTVTRPA